MADNSLTLTAAELASIGERVSQDYGEVCFDPCEHIECAAYRDRARLHAALVGLIETDGHMFAIRVEKRLWLFKTWADAIDALLAQVGGK